MKWLRKLRDLSQTELGRLVGMDQSLISKIEKNKRKLEFGEAGRLARALGCTLNDLEDTDGPVTITITLGPAKTPDEEDVVA